MADNLVLMDHDGGVDDYLSTALLLTMEHLRVLGIVVTPADCYIQPAVAATRKLLDLMGRSDIPVAESTVRGLNPFPRIFRRYGPTAVLQLVQKVSERGQPLMVG